MRVKTKAAKAEPLRMEQNKSCKTKNLKAKFACLKKTIYQTLDNLIST